MSLPLEDTSSVGRQRQRAELRRLLASQAEGVVVATALCAINVQDDQPQAIKDDDERALMPFERAQSPTWQVLRALMMLCHRDAARIAKGGASK